MDLKNLAAVIVAVTAMGTAIGACVHKQPEDAARAGYLELTKAILDSQEARKQDHEDLVALSKAFGEYVKGHESIVTAVPAPSVEPPLPIPFIGPPAPPSTGTPAPTKFYPSKPGEVSHVLAAAPSAAPAPPLVRPLMKVAPPKKFDSLL